MFAPSAARPFEEHVRGKIGHEKQRQGDEELQRRRPPSDPDEHLQRAHEPERYHEDANRGHERLPSRVIASALGECLHEHEEAERQQPDAEERPASHKSAQPLRNLLPHQKSSPV